MKLFKFFSNHSKSGFTLVELLVVMGVLGVLVSSAIILINPKAQIDRAHDAQRKSDLSNIQKGLELYYDDYRKYPDNAPSGNYVTVLENLGYIKKVPLDPVANAPYFYVPDSTGQSYKLYAKLEAKEDPQACTSAGCIAACGTGTVCYGVSSSNVTP